MQNVTIVEISHVKIEFSCPALLNDLHSFSLGKRRSILGSNSEDFPTLGSYNSNICFPRKLSISPNVFYVQCLTSDISLRW